MIKCIPFGNCLDRISVINFDILLYVIILHSFIEMTNEENQKHPMLLKLYWAEDNLGEGDKFCYESCPWRWIDRF